MSGMWMLCYTINAWPGPVSISDQGRVYTELEDAQKRLKQLHEFGYIDTFIVRLEREHGNV